MKMGCSGVVVILLGVFYFWFFYLSNVKENGLINEGNTVVKKLEAFRLIHHKLPDSLAEVGVLENEQTELYLGYTRKDSNYYVVWIGISSEESKFYYSDTKKWEDYLR